VLKNAFDKHLASALADAGFIKLRSSLRFVLLLIVILSPFLDVHANEPNQKKESISENVFVLPRIGGEVSLDGISDEPAWDHINPLPLTVYMPDFGSEPSEPTEIRIAYDDNFLYVAGRLYDSEPSKIQDVSKKRDEMNLSNDLLGLYIDSFCDKENALGFWVMPSGLRTDMAILNDGEGQNPSNISWNTFWDAATVKNSSGWFVEIRIPFSSLRFQDVDGRVVMGLTVMRWIARKNEMSIFPAIEPKKGSWNHAKPSKAQEVLLKGVFSQKPVYWAPYIAAGLGRSYALNEDESGYSPIKTTVNEIGLDIKYGIASNLTLDVTVNPDFAQVEADDLQINLTRFSLFFPEKRLFFQERSSIFEFNFESPNRLFYSRRIGLHNGKLVRIYGGAHLVGRIGSWDLGFLSMQTDSSESLPSENFTLCRFRRQIINPYSYIGSIVLSRVGTDGQFNVAYGLDGTFRLFGDDYFIVKWAQTFKKGEQNNPASLKPARIYANWERRTLKGFAYSLSYSRAGIDYQPGIGFELRKNFTQLSQKVLYGWMPGGNSSFLRHHVFLEGFITLRNPDSSIESAELGPGWTFTAKSGASGTVLLKGFLEDVRVPFFIAENIDVPKGRFSFVSAYAKYGNPKSSLIHMTNTLEIGTFFDGWKVSWGLIPRWSISSSLELSGAYQLDHIDFSEREKRLTAHIGRIRLLAMLSTKFSAAAFIQYDSASKNIVSNIRIRYNPREGVDLYLVYNDDLNTRRYRRYPSLPPFNNRAVMLKYVHTFISR